VALRIVVVDATLAGVAVGPPLSLEGVAASPLALLDEAHECLLCEGVWIYVCGRLRRATAAALVHQTATAAAVWTAAATALAAATAALFTGRHLPTRRQLLLLSVEAETCGLALRECDLYGAQLPSLGHQDPLLVHVLNGALGIPDLGDADEGATRARGAACGVDEKHLEHLAELLKGFCQHLLSGLQRQAADEEFHSTLRLLYLRASVLLARS
jgi:hypothetical protein